MFNNIGKKIKVLAEFSTYIGIALCIFSGLLVIFYTIINQPEDCVFVILIVPFAVLAGSLTCYISSFALYAFGQLVDNSDKLVKALVPDADTQESVPSKTKSSPKTSQNLASIDYSGKSWAENIHQLSNEELENRINSNDWQDSYKALCKKELESRN